MKEQKNQNRVNDGEFMRIEGFYQGYICGSNDTGQYEK